MYFNNDKKQYIAIIGDIVDSKKIQDRDKAQSRLKDTLSAVNKWYSNSIASDFIITLGDEFQGLLKSGEEAIRIIEEIEYKMYPVKIRFGIGIGEITTEIDPKMSLGADGPAYYNARQMIEELKAIKNKTGEYNIKLKSGNDCDILINVIFSLLYVLKSHWTDRQREVVHASYYYTVRQSRIAEMFKMTQPTIQQILKRANYVKYGNAMETLEKILSEIGEN